MPADSFYDNNNNNNNNNNGEAAGAIFAAADHTHTHTNTHGIITNTTAQIEENEQNIDQLYEGVENMNDMLLKHNNGIKFLLEHCCGGEARSLLSGDLLELFGVRTPRRDQGGGGKRKKRGKKRRKTRKINN